MIEKMSDTTVALYVLLLVYRFQKFNFQPAALLFDIPVLFALPPRGYYRTKVDKKSKQSYLIFLFFFRFENKLKFIPENCIESYEDWIKEASVIFHQNHYLITGVKYTLSLLYGKTDGFLLQDLSHDLLQRKIKICEELLDIANIIQPGLSRLRGNYANE